MLKKKTLNRLQEPLFFDPEVHEKIWGGARLYELLQKGTQKHSRLGEIWELTDQGEQSSMVSKGSFHGISLRNILEQYEKDVYGSIQNIPKKFPLLYKFIHAKEALSVQVHPGENSIGDAKTEMWYVLEAPKDASIIVGLNSEDSPQNIFSKLTTSRAIEVLNYIPVEVGDVFLIPAGTVHAITPGLVIYEVQQNSDTTYRLYDWDRVDDHGNGRKLHIQEASEVIDYRVHQKHKIPSLEISMEPVRVSYLVGCPYFALRKYEFNCLIENEPIVYPLIGTGSFKVISVMRGEFLLHYGEKSVTLTAGDTVLLPASIWNLKEQKCGGPVQISCSQGGYFLESFIPDLDQDILQPLLQVGYSRDEIRRLGGIDTHF